MRCWPLRPGLSPLLRRKLLHRSQVGLVNVGSAYGAAGSVVVFVFWVYYSAQIFLFGAEVIKVQRKDYSIGNKSGE